MAVVAHIHHIQVVTRFRAQVMWRALALVAAGVLTWLLPVRDAGQAEGPGRGLGSVLTEVQPLPALGVLVLIAALAFAWQARRPADMGALAWVVAGGVLGLGSTLLVLFGVWAGGSIYGWLALGVVVTSMLLQVLAALAGHALAVLTARRHP